MKHQFVPFLLILSLLAGCTSAPTAPAPTAPATATIRSSAATAATLPPAATVTSRPVTARPVTFTPTLAPTSTSLPTGTPTPRPTPTPTPVVISAYSAAQVVQLASYGSGSLAGMALSPDGETIAIAGSLGVWLVDAQTYEKLRLLKGPTDLEVNGRANVAWSPDGVYVASTGRNSMIWVWEAASGQAAHVLTGQVGQGEVARLGWSPDGHWLTTLIGEWLLVWDLDGEVVRLAFHGYREPHPGFPPDPGDLHGFGWSPDGTRLATITWNSYVQLWDALSGEELRRVKLGSDLRTTDLAWSPDGQTLAVSAWRLTTSRDQAETNTVSLLSAQNLAVQRTFDAGEVAVNALHWSPDGNYLAAASWTARVWDVQNGGLVFDVSNPDDTLAGQHTLFWSLDGSRLITRCRENGLALCTWDLATQALLEKSPALFAGKTYSVAWSPDGETLAVGSQYSPAQLLDADSGVLRQVAPGSMAGYRDVFWSPDGQRLLASDNYWINAWELQSNTVITQVVNVWSGAYAWSPDVGRWVLTYGSGIRFGGPEWSEMQVVENPWSFSVKVAAWSPDGQWIAVGGQPYSGSSSVGALHLYNPFTRQDLALSVPDEDESHYVGSLAWSKDGSALAAGYYGGLAGGFVVHIWDTRQLGAAESIPLAAVLPGHSAWITSLAWSADGRMLASGDHAGQIRLWSAQAVLENAAAVAATPLAGHSGDVHDLDWSPDGLRLASAGEDGTLRIWGVPQGAVVRVEIGLPERAAFPAAALPGDLPVMTAENGPELRLLTALGSGTVTDLAPSPDGRFAALASTHGVWIYAVETLEALHWLRFPNNGLVQSLAWSPDGGRLAVRGQSGWWGGRLQSVVWETKTWNLERIMELPQGGEWKLQITLNLIWSPDGKWLAAAESRRLFVWDAASGSLLGEWQTGIGTFATPQSILAWLPSDAHHPLGRIVAGGGEIYGSGHLMVWDAASGALLQNDPLPPRVDGYDFSLPVNLALSPDGRSLALIGGMDGLQVWRDNGAGLVYDASFNSPQNEFSETWDAAWSPDGKTILVAGKQWVESGYRGTLWLLDAGSGEVLLRLHPHASDVLAAAWLPAPQGDQAEMRFLSAEQEGCLRLWELSFEADGGEPRAELKQSTRTSSSALLAAGWSADSSRLAVISDLGVLRVWDANSGKLLDTQEAFPQAKQALEGAAFAPQSDRLALGLHQGVQVWQVSPWQMRQEVSLAEASDYALLAWSPDGLYLAAVAFSFSGGSSSTYVLAVWEVSSGALRLQQELGKDDVLAMAWSADGDLIAIGDSKGRLRLWGLGEALASGQASASLVGSSVFPQNNYFGSLAWSPDGQHLAAGVHRISDLEYLALFNRYGGLLSSLDTGVLQGGFNALGWSPDGGLVATAGFDGGVLGLWESRAWNQVGGRYYGAHAHLESGWNIINALVWSPDGRLIASLGADGVARLWGAP